MSPEDYNTFQEHILETNRRLANGDRRMNTFETLIEENRLAHQANAKALQENTDLTKEIKEILDLGKTFFKILKYVGIVAKWVTVIGSGVAVIWAALQGSTPKH